MKDKLSTFIKNAGNWFLLFGVKFDDPLDIHDHFVVVKLLKYVGQLSILGGPVVLRKI
jgi:hypothetical protein